MIHSELPTASIKDWLLSFIGLRMRLRVTGDSMLPSLKAGDLVLADKKAYKAVLPKMGDVVVAMHPIKKELKIIKRVALIEDDGRVFLLSDNPEGSDSRQFGFLKANDVLAKVISYSPA